MNIFTFTVFLLIYYFGFFGFMGFLCVLMCVCPRLYVSNAFSLILFFFCWFVCFILFWSVCFLFYLILFLDVCLFSNEKGI